MGESAQHPTLLEALRAAARPFQALPFPALTTSVLRFAGELCAYDLLHQRHTVRQREALIQAAGDQLMQHIVGCLAVVGSEAEPDMPPTHRAGATRGAGAQLTRPQQRVLSAIMAAFPAPIAVGTLRQQLRMRRPYPVLRALIDMGLIQRIWQGQYGLVVPEEQGEGEHHV